MPILVEIGRVVLKKKMKIYNVYTQMDRRQDGQTTDNRRSKKLTWAFSSGELKRVVKVRNCTKCIFKESLWNFWVSLGFRILFLRCILNKLLYNMSMWLFVQVGAKWILTGVKFKNRVTIFIETHYYQARCDIHNLIICRSVGLRSLKVDDLYKQVAFLKLWWNYKESLQTALGTGL